MIGVASGPWQTIAESTTPLTQTTFTPRADKPKAKLTMQPLRPEDPKNNPSYPASTRPARPGQPPATLPAYSELTVTYPMSLWSYEVDRPETRIVAVVNGSEVPSEGRRTSGSGTTWDETVAFKAAPEAVQAVRFQARPYEPVVFDNISLRPNVQTAPTVTLKNVGEPLSQPAAKR